MKQYLVSARKYRPTKFTDVVGQSHVTTTLKNAIKSNQVAQSFLFCGPRGVGKTTCARILAKVLNCQNQTEDFEPCNKCGSCTSFNDNASFNIFELDAASNNSVEDIRQLIEQVRFAPQTGKYKVYIIDEVHMLSSAAFNAFLKTLEEPPSYAIFILATTEKHKLLPTIISRCQVFDFHRISNQDMVGHLTHIAEQENLQAEQEALHIIAQKADGGLRDALSIYDRMSSFANGEITYQAVLENLNILDYDYFFKITDGIQLQDRSMLMLTINEILRNGFDGAEFLNGLCSHLRNLMMAKAPNTVKILEVSNNWRNRYAEQAQALSTGFILSCLNIANTCALNYREAKNKRLQIELALLKMCYINQAIDLSKQPIIAPQTLVQAEEKKTEVVSSQPVTTPVASQQTQVVAKQPTVQQQTNTEPNVVAPITNENTTEDKPTKKTTFKMGSAGSGLNLGKSLADLEGDILKQAQEKVKPNLEHNQKNLTNLWNKYINQHDSPITSGILSENPLTIQGNNISVVTNVSMHDATIKNELKAFREQLKQNYENVDLVIDVKYVKKEAENIHSKVAYTTKDKYEQMLAKNPSLAKLKDTFGLEFEY
ncbi:UNVERIFIED_CONTAM: hypothetical protein GTU68_021289 [Idotea baltica]|nr:hypothetical protein [Idotea baltica]